MRGRRPKPLEVRKREGNLRKTGVIEPLKFNVLSGFPEPPSTLGERGATEWRTTGRKLWDLEVLQSTDIHQFEAYCIELDRYFDINNLLNKQLSEYGTQALVVTTEKGALKPNPYLQIERQSLDKLQKLATEFGLSPTSRARLGLGKVGKPKTEQDSVEDKYFGHQKRR